MVYYMVKVGISAGMIVLISELAKRSSFIGALIASLPLTSLLAIIWMQFEKAGEDKISQLSRSIFWLVLPSLGFFLLFPALLHRGLHFWPSMGIAVLATIVLYFILVYFLRSTNILLP